MKENTILIESDLEQFIIIASFRYALGRRSYAPSILVSFLKKNWSKINEIDRTLIKKEIRESIEKGQAGDPSIDVYEWETVLRL